MNEFLSLPEAAKILGITRIAVFKKVKKNQIKAIRIGRNWAIPSAELAGSFPAGASSGGEPPKSVSARNNLADTPGVNARRMGAGSDASREAKKDALDDMGWD